MAHNIPTYYPTLAEQVAGREIMRPQLVNQYQIDQISKNLRDQVSKSIKDMKLYGATEESSESPHSQFPRTISMTPQEVYNSLSQTPRKRGKKVTSKVLRKFDVSYEVPRFCIENNIDMDHSVLYDASTGDATINIKRPELSFFHRLHDWSLELRERSNGKMRDVYYIFLRTGTTFRSKKEVVQFIIYEKYPPNSSSNEKGKKQEEIGEGSGASNEASGREKLEADDFEEEGLGINIDELAEQREKVEKFLSESYDNLMKWGRRRN